MKTKIVYVLVCVSSDYYREMLILSLLSLKRHHPKDSVILVLDRPTWYLLTNENSVILKYVTPIIAEVPHDFNLTQRSRFLKTNLRQIVNGDYLYIDVDTIICGRLDSVDSFDTDIAMAYEIEGERIGVGSPEYLEKCEKAGFFSLKNESLFNGGVIYSKDSTISRTFYKTWHQLWKDSNERGMSKDMPALCQANVNLGHPIKELPRSYNLLFCNRFGIRDIRNSKIIHYYYCNSWSKDRLLLFSQIKKKQSMGLIARLIIYFPHSFLYLIYAKRNLIRVYYKVKKLFT